MERKIAPFVLLLVAVVAVPVAAQDDCGFGLPCGAIPWEMPDFPELISPTPWIATQVDYYFATPTPSDTPTPSSTPTETLTPTPVFTSTPFWNVAPVDDSLATLEAVLNVTQTPVYNASGTPVSVSDFSELESNSAVFWGYAKGLTSTSFGAITPLISFGVLTFLTVLAVKISAFALPLVMALIGVVRKIIQLILDFIPG
jgi:hypothetical protein